MAVRTVTRQRQWSWELGAELGERLHSLAYAEVGKRDLRFDFLRGLAVTMMVVDHIGGDTLLTHLTGGNQFIVSAAEAFIFLSGVVLGMVYGERIVRAGPREAVRGMLQRAATLYKASVGMALAFVALFLLTDVRLWVDRSSALSGTDPLGTLIGILTLHHAFHGSDVLVMYTIMLAVAPAIVYLLHKGQTPLVLLGSLALWGAYQRFPEEATVPWTIVGSAFPVAAWQLLFVLGMATGYYRNKVTGWLSVGAGSTRLALAGAASALYLLIRGKEMFESVVLPGQFFAGATYGSLFDKPDLGPGRVLAFLACAVLAYTAVSSLWVPLKGLLGWFFLPLGQASLYVYITHIFVLVLIYNLAPVVASMDLGIQPDTINLAAQLSCLSLVYVMVRTRFLFNLVPR